MEYIENDNEIIFMINEPNDDATEYLINKYKGIIEYFVKKYITITSKIGIDRDDLYQEGLVGLIEAINKYNEFRNVKFNTYASNMIKFHIIKIIEKGLRCKNKVLNESLSLEYEYDDNLSLEGLIGEDYILDKLIIKDEIDRIKSFIYNKINNKDRKILLYYINGYSKKDISNMLNITIKSVTNSLYKSKNRIKVYLNKII